MVCFCNYCTSRCFCCFLGVVVCRKDASVCRVGSEYGGGVLDRGRVRRPSLEVFVC